MVRYAGFWLRFIAYVIDGVIVDGVALVLGGVIGVLFRSGNPGPATILSSSLVGVVWVLGYFAGMESSAWQATLGKLAVGIRVTDLEGRRIGFGRALARTLGKIPSSVLFGIGFLMAGWTARKQALHDLLAGTLVVKAGAGADAGTDAGAPPLMSGRAPDHATPRGPQ